MTDAVQVENSSLDLPLTGWFFDFGNILFFHILDATVLNKTHSNRHCCSQTQQGQNQHVGILFDEWGATFVTNTIPAEIGRYLGCCFRKIGSEHVYFIRFKVTADGQHFINTVQVRNSCLEHLFIGQLFLSLNAESLQFWSDFWSCATGLKIMFETKEAPHSWNFAGGGGVLVEKVFWCWLKGRFGGARCGRRILVEGAFWWKVEGVFWCWLKGRFGGAFWAF